jgi:hypothetical protein
VDYEELGEVAASYNCPTGEVGMKYLVYGLVAVFAGLRAVRP